MIRAARAAAPQCSRYGMSHPSLKRRELPARCLKLLSRPLLTAQKAALNAVFLFFKCARVR